MSKLIRVLMVFLAIVWAGPASAALMAPVLVDGREWLQPMDFVNISWYDIAEVCDPITGACTGSLGGDGLSGWTWANTDDTYALLAHFWPYELCCGEFPANGVYGNEFAEYFWAAGFQFVEDISAQVGVIRVTAGFTRTTYVSGSGYAYAAVVGTSQSGLDPYFPNWTFGKEIVSPGIGGLFYRDPVSPIPTPATLSLLGLGLAALGYSRRKRNLQS
jgi:hypothetical protein